MKNVLILVVLLAFTLNEIFAAQSLYISPTGNDKNNGTKEQPLASLKGARDLVRNLRDRKLTSDTDTVYIYVMPGNYFMTELLSLDNRDRGTAESPVVFTADPAERPVFYGGFKLNKFEEISKNLWCAYIPEVVKYGFSFEQMYINGQRRFRAQTPNRGDFFMVKDISETILAESGGRRALLASQKIKPLPADAGFLFDASKTDVNDVLTVFYHKWDNTRKRILEINLADSSFFTIGLGMKPWNRIDSTSRYVVENYREALDSPGEWYLSKDGYLYYIPMPGETIENTECMVPVIDKFIVITGDKKTGTKVGHIRFENLRFRVAGYKTPYMGDESQQAANPVEATVMVDFADHIDFYNCEIANTGLNAIWFRQNCSKSSVVRCHLHDLGAGGIKIGHTRLNTDRNADVTNHITVHNNIIQHGGNVFPSATGVIIFHGHDNVITHNDIANFRYTGVSVGWVWGYTFSPSKRNKIEFNHIHHLGWGELSDMGGVYTLGPSEGTTISNNVIHHIYSFDYGGWGLYTDEGSSNILMENNLVYHCSNAGYMHHFGKDNIIRNNIFAFNVETQVQFGLGEDHRMFSFLRNIVYSNQGSTVNSTWNTKEGLKASATEFNYNCYWDTRNSQLDFHGLGFKDWKQLGRDKSSIIADPLFIDPENFDFRFRRQTVAKKIGFMPFDYSKAGVYGDQEWKDNAKLPGELKEAFGKAVEKNAWRGIYGWYEFITE
jgi:hypothetical protein